MERSQIITVVLLGTAGLVAVGGIIFLAAIGRPAPEALIAMGGGALGALGTFLSRNGGGYPKGEKP